MAIELPEALTLARQMAGELRGKRIERVHLGEACASLIRQGFVNLHEVDVSRLTVESVTSKGKWIFVHLRPGMVLLFAIETGGKILVHAGPESLPKKFHVKLDLGDGSFLTEQIVGWGWAKAFPEGEPERQRYPGKLGLSPVSDEEFTMQAFGAILNRGSRKKIKQVLLEQTQIAGIGNGYVQDILFRAKLHPARKAGDIDESQRLGLYRAIIEMLSEAVRLGGCQFEVDLYNHPGGYQRLLGDHVKGQPCPVCGTPIEKITLQGAASYLCPVCQT
jgi:formamidopyrimidine-DNA glycosylase